MKLIIATRDRSEDLGPWLREQADAMQSLPSDRRPTVLPAIIAAKSLAHVTHESQFQDEFLRLLRYREGVDTLPFRIPRRPGLLGALMATAKKGLWKLCRYQWDRITFRQNLINTFYNHALEYEQQQRKRDVTRLEQRITSLEKRLKGEHDR